MPLHDIHRQKKYKNYALLVVMLAVVALFFTASLVKIKHIMTPEVPSHEQPAGEKTE